VLKAPLNSKQPNMKHEKTKIHFVIAFAEIDKMSSFRAYVMFDSVIYNISHKFETAINHSKNPINTTLV